MLYLSQHGELALEWEESQRKVMYDPHTADYFLQYTDGKGNKNGTIYQEDITWGDQFFWDFTNPKAADYFISSVVDSPDDPAVDGTFTNDVGGLPQEHGHVMSRINMNVPQLKALQVCVPLSLCPSLSLSRSLSLCVSPCLCRCVSHCVSHCVSRCVGDTSSTDSRATEHEPVSDLRCSML